MEDSDVLHAELEEKEDGELDSDLEENRNIASESPNLHEDAIDELLASCNTSGDVDERISLKSFGSSCERASRKEKEIPSTYRKRSNDGSSRVEKSIRSKDNHRSESPTRPKSRRRKQKQRTRNDSKEKGVSKSDTMQRKSKSVSVDIVNIEEEMREKTGQDKEITVKVAEESRIRSKKDELGKLEKRKEKLEEDARKIEEKKTRLAKSERSVMMKKGYISDMCKRRDDYVARVKRLIEDIERNMKEEEGMIKETDDLRNELNEDEVNWQMETNQLASDQLTTMMRMEEESDDVVMVEEEEVVSDGREEEEEVTSIEDEPEVIKNTSMDDHDEETLRNLLLMQLQSKERSAEAEPSNGERENGEVTPVEESEGEEMEQEESEMQEDRVEVATMVEGDTGSTMCPWDLNGICKDDECPYVHNRASSRLDYSQEITT